ncbi:hypothetical protein F4820DRAFT_445849 [Hypoxylon rubiginosum]|uniref:Uncharacterized protein n=1 Tax=Hypoxylon rubiginosum TaxID=110542 RepID=A0ACB9Z8J1_9PEZI|nr:hypothetical protein F4820DRAFT_445849 [Hypoxylon rubiginosum]
MTLHRADIAARDTLACPIQDSSELSLKINGFSFSQLDSQPGDIPPGFSTAQVSFTVTNPLNWRQACSGTVIKQQDGVWQDADGSMWFRCGTSSTPDPACSNCTHFQFGWGHESWRLALNQTWPCDPISYEVSGSTILDPECTPSTNSYFSCSAPDFSLSVALKDQ